MSKKDDEAAAQARHEANQAMIIKAVGNLTVEYTIAASSPEKFEAMAKRCDIEGNLRGLMEKLEATQKASERAQLEVAQSGFQKMWAILNGRFYGNQ
jgi:hypothetical protein